MAGQRLKQHNAGSQLRLKEEDLLIAGETPRFDGKAMRLVRMRIARDGFAERSIHDFGFGPSGFWHFWNLLSPDQVEEIAAAIRAAQAGMKKVDIDEDPNGHYRLIQCWLDGRRGELKMRYVESVAQVDVPEFEAAWSLVVRQFPDLADPAEPDTPPDHGGR